MLLVKPGSSDSPRFFFGATADGGTKKSDGTLHTHFLIYKNQIYGKLNGLSRIILNSNNFYKRTIKFVKKC